MVASVPFVDADCLFVLEKSCLLKMNNDVSFFLKKALVWKYLAHIGRDHCCWLLVKDLVFLWPLDGVVFEL